MAEPAPAFTPGARGTLRLATGAALLLAAGFLVGYFVPAGGDAGSSSSSTPSGPARPHPAATPAPPGLPALRAENEILREKVAAMERRPRREAPGSPADIRPLQPGAPPTDSSPGTASLRVLVVDGAGAPAAGALVRTLVFNGPQVQDQMRVETDARGIADFAGLAPGARRIAVHRSGFSVECDPILVAGRTLEVPVTIEAGVPFRGVVRHAQTGPLKDVMVSLHRREGPLWSNVTAHSRSGGEFRFDSVAPGPWVVWLTGGDFGSTRQVGILLVPEGGPLERDIVVGVPRLHGRVRDRSTGAAIPGARISITSGGLDQPMLTDGAGDYRLLDLSPGPYGLQVSKQGYGIRWFRGVEVPEEGRKFDIEMAPAAALTFRVKKADGSPYEGMLFLSAEPKDPESGTRVSTSINIDGAGTGSYSQIAPGAYTLRFRMPGVGEAAALETEIPAGASTLDVRLSEK